MKIGITGHQNLDNQDWVKAEIIRILQCDESPLLGISSLAVGADQLFAQAVIECGGQLEAIIPFAKYDEVFKDAGRAEYRRLLALASKKDVLPDSDSNEASYLAAGKRVADLADLLIAVWNGKPAAGIGGTGDIVEYALHAGKRIVHLNPENQLAVHL